MTAFCFFSPPIGGNQSGEAGNRPNNLVPVQCLLYLYKRPEHLISTFQVTLNCVYYKIYTSYILPTIGSNGFSLARHYLLSKIDPIFIRMFSLALFVQDMLNMQVNDFSETRRLSKDKDKINILSPNARQLAPYTVVCGHKLRS